MGNTAASTLCRPSSPQDLRQLSNLKHSCLHPPLPSTWKTTTLNKTRFHLAGKLVANLHPHWQPLLLFGPCLVVLPVCVVAVSQWLWSSAKKAKHTSVHRRYCFSYTIFGFQLMLGERVVCAAISLHLYILVFHTSAVVHRRWCFSNIMIFGFAKCWVRG